MKTFTSQATAKYGVYISAVPPDVCFVGSDGETLEGRSGAKYRHIPTLLVLALSPLFGAAFVMLFPVFILAGVALAATAMVSERINGFASEHAYLVRVGWEPVTAYLNKKAGPNASVDGKKDGTMAALEREVDARRKDADGKA